MVFKSACLYLAYAIVMWFTLTLGQSRSIKNCLLFVIIITCFRLSLALKA